MKTRTLNRGCGRNKRQGAIGMDRVKLPEVDLPPTFLRLKNEVTNARKRERTSALQRDGARSALSLDLRELLRREGPGENAHKILDGWLVTVFLGRLDAMSHQFEDRF